MYFWNILYKELMFIFSGEMLSTVNSLRVYYRKSMNYYYIYIFIYDDSL